MLKTYTANNGQSITYDVTELSGITTSLVIVIAVHLNNMMILSLNPESKTEIKALYDQMVADWAEVKDPDLTISMDTAVEAIQNWLQSNEVKVIDDNGHAIKGTIGYADGSILKALVEARYHKKSAFQVKLEAIKKDRTES